MNTELLVESLKMARDTSTQLVSLSLGILAFSVAFLKEPPQRRLGRVLMGILWASFLASIIVGTAVLLSTTGNLAIAASGGERSLTPYEDNIRTLFSAQVVSFWLGSAMLALVGILRLATSR